MKGGVGVMREGARGVIRRPGIVRSASGVAALVALAGAAWMAQTEGAAAPVVALRATEFLYAPKKALAHAGEVVFVVKNEGAIEHNFVLQDASTQKIAEIAVIEPRTSGEVRATLAPGTYAILCTLPGHRDAGMVASLVVTP